jgi:hypothetical protein
MRAPLALFLLTAVLATSATVCGSSTPVDMWINTDAGAGFDAPAREVHPADAEGTAGAGGAAGTDTTGAGGAAGGAAGIGGDTSGGAAGVGVGGNAGAAGTSS